VARKQSYDLRLTLPDVRQHPAAPSSVRSELNETLSLRGGALEVSRSAQRLPFVRVWVATARDRIAFRRAARGRTARPTSRWAKLRPSTSARTSSVWDDVIDAMAVKYTGEPFPFRPETGILCLLDVESAKVRLLPFRHV